jgi:hypothetical protein
MILILTAPSDAHADNVAQKLRDRGAGFVRFNPAQFPTEAELSLGYTATGQTRTTLRIGRETLDLSRVTAVWYRRPDPPVAHVQIADAATRTFVEEECSGFMQDTLQMLRCLWVPAQPAVDQMAHLKAAQLEVAGALGFELPPTLITTSPADFLAFYREHNGNVVSKLAGGAFFGSLIKTYTRYTEVVSKRDLGYAQALRYCPVIFQAYVPKRIELRITVVGRRVFAAEIHSQASNHTRHDWRRYDMAATPHFAHDLPPAVEQRCLQLVERLGLTYGAIDMVVTPDGRYVFLEINPNGQYLWIEEAAGLPISDAICDLLMSGSQVKRVAA